MSINNQLDLSKIAVKEMPTKVIKANFDGTEKEYTIRSLTEGEMVNFQALLVARRDVMRVRSMYIMLLSCGLGWEQDVCDILWDNCNAEAMRVGDAIWEFHNSVEKAKAEEAEKAEKNSRKGAEPEVTAP